MPRNLFTSDLHRHVHVRTRGYLPHWEIDGGTYFITLRTADSLSQQHLAELDEYRRELERQAKGKPVMARQQLAKAMLARVDALLDRGHGSCPFMDKRLAQLVADSVQYFDGHRYELLTWCVMPNHAHVQARLLRGVSLARVLHSWKSYSGNKINELRGVEGRLWAREYYDHLAREEEEVLRIDRYIRENPVKAKLTDWPWVGSKLSG